MIIDIKKGNIFLCRKSFTITEDQIRFESGLIYEAPNDGVIQNGEKYGGWNADIFNLHFILL